MPDRHLSVTQRLRSAARSLRRRARTMKRAAGRTGRATRSRWLRLRASRLAQRLATAAAILLIGTAAAAGGLILVGDTSADIGPFHTTMALHPDIHGETIVAVPPLGQVVFDSHDGPVGMNLRLDSVDPEEAQVIISSPGGVTSASEDLASEVTDAVVRVAIEALAIVTLCGLLVGALTFRTMRRTMLTGLASLSMTAALMGYAVSTLQPESISEPRYEGLLSYAPSVVGNAEDIAENYEEYVANLQKFVTNISGFYALATDMPQIGVDDDTIRVMHVSDLHLNPSAWPLMETVAEQFNIDVIADTGDMNQWGSEQEAEIYSRGVAQLDVPYVFIKGNHDSATTVAALAAYDNVVVLDGEVQTVEGLRFAGVADPRFTPDKGNQPSSEYAQQMLTQSGERLAETVEEAGGADVAMVHEPPMSLPLTGVVPLVLSGHTHERAVQDLGEGTTLMVEGSTGAAGLRVFDTEEPLKMDLDVLYFDPGTKALTAYDSISVGTVGESDITLDRTVIPADELTEKTEDADTAPPGPPESPGPPGPPGD